MSRRKKKPKRPIMEAVNPEYPFTLEACADKPAFPTHSHGLTQIGWPEFFIDPFAFGATGNARRIERSYDYFKRPENLHLLQSILQGKTVKLIGKDLGIKEDPRDLHVYCFREAPPTFEGVKRAYPGEWEVSTVLGMRFVQIYIQGDEDFALSDEYYRAGVRG